jgi:uncharacterized membrane protein YeaQ/YmgE (transglycosylase-associated protein family)
MLWDILGFLIFGLIVGLVARAIRPGKQALTTGQTLGLGVVGSLIGGAVASLIGTGDFFELDFLGAVVAIVSAVVLLGVVSGSRR